MQVLHSVVYVGAPGAVHNTEECPHFREKFILD